jgi:hypothetical protein|nr:MAG TPA: hypothetical protein [Caudoviricetes sp.]DAM41683.1 MAG TPA: hypothetical protein [Caudoviricetes sp.]DAO12121.1 MAG TPA: hypothetical protein [Caudoviricetes sp.]DAT17080.1 MAG TPA: hypothetical protein [Caudoviricetes sp.]
MSRKLGIVKVKSDITKFTEIMARDYELEAFEVTGILAQVLIEWQKRELIESNDEFSRVLKDLNEKLSTKEEQN